MTLSKLLGVYHFEHPKGSFEVHLRSEGRFFAPKFQARASWVITEGGQMTIDWGKFGQYEMNLTDPATRAFQGSVLGQPENWRKVLAAPAAV